MLIQINQLEKQHGGAIPFSALEKKQKQKKTKKKSPPKRKKKRSVSPARVHRKNTRRLKRSKKKSRKRKKDKAGKCKCGSHTFTGKEETPRGLGKCDECIPLNVVLKGKDGKLYENRKEGWHKLNQALL